MKVWELIEMLADLSNDDEVLIWCADSGEMAPVTGCYHGGGDGKVELTTMEG